MAERELSGNDVLLLIDPDGGTDYIIVVCLRNNGFSGSTQVIESITKCGTTRLPGTKSAEVPIAGDVLLGNDEDEKLSMAQLFTLWNDKTIFSFKQAKETEVVGDVSYTGKGFFSSFKNDNGVNAVSTFDGTITTTQDLVQAIKTV